MKRLIYFLIFIFLSINFPSNNSFADTESYYAKVDANTFFYSSPIQNDDNKLFQIPSTYFVLLIGNENDLFYQAKYSNIDGYVLKSSVTPINEKPENPYANTSFRVFASTSLYSSQDGNNEIMEIPALSEITTYYGISCGLELLPKSTDKWYYCKYSNNDVNINGYIFSYYCDQFQEIVPNNETYTPINEKIFTNEEITLPSNTSLNTALIVICCIVPSLCILLLLLKKKDRKSVNKILKKPKHDYFEFNEDDI